MMPYCHMVAVAVNGLNCNNIMIIFPRAREKRTIYITICTLSENNNSIAISAQFQLLCLYTQAES